MGYDVTHMIQKDPLLHGTSIHCVVYLELKDAVTTHILSQTLPILKVTTKPLGSECWQVSADMIRYWGQNPSGMRTKGETLEYLSQEMSAVELEGEGEDPDAEDENFIQDFSV